MKVDQSVFMNLNSMVCLFALKTSPPTKGLLLRRYNQILIFHLLSTLLRDARRRLNSNLDETRFNDDGFVRGQVLRCRTKILDIVG